MPEDTSDKGITQDTPHHIFDTVFKRLMQLSSAAIIQLINGLFGKQYPLDSTVTLLNTEYMTPTFHQWRSDIVILINQTDTYVIEAQLKNDEEMALRIFYYSYFEGSKTKIIERTKIRVRMAPVIVIYFEPIKTTPDELELEVTAQDTTVHTFRFPTFKFLDHSIGELAERNLSMLLPFYLLKLRNRVKSAAERNQVGALSDEMKHLIAELVQTIERSEQNGQLSEADMRAVLAEMGALYEYLYKTYPEFKETNGMVDKALWNVADKAEMAGKEIKAKEIAQYLIREGWNTEKIAEATQLDLLTVESLMGTAQA